MRFLTELLSDLGVVTFHHPLARESVSTLADWRRAFGTATRNLRGRDNDDGMGRVILRYEGYTNAR